MHTHVNSDVVVMFRAMQELQIRFQPESSVAPALQGSISTSSETISGKHHVRLSPSVVFKYSLNHT